MSEKSLKILLIYFHSLQKINQTKHKQHKPNSEHRHLKHSTTRQAPHTPKASQAPLSPDPYLSLKVHHGKRQM